MVATGTLRDAAAAAAAAASTADDDDYYFSHAEMDNYANPVCLVGSGTFGRTQRSIARRHFPRLGDCDRGCSAYGNHHITDRHQIVALLSPIINTEEEQPTRMTIGRQRIMGKLPRNRVFKNPVATMTTTITGGAPIIPPPLATRTMRRTVATSKQGSTRTTVKEATDTLVNVTTGSSGSSMKAASTGSGDPSAVSPTSLPGLGATRSSWHRLDDSKILQQQQQQQQSPIAGTAVAISPLPPPGSKPILTPIRSQRQPPPPRKVPRLNQNLHDPVPSQIPNKVPIRENGKNDDDDEIDNVTIRSDGSTTTLISSDGNSNNSNTCSHDSSDDEIHPRAMKNASTTAARGNSNHSSVESPADANMDDSSAIMHPRPNDILLGRGQMIISHMGNRQFHDLCALIRTDYLEMNDTVDRKRTALEVYYIVQNQLHGRFLERRRKAVTKRTTTAAIPCSEPCWQVVPVKRALEKISQALRDRRSRSRRDHETTTPTDLQELLQKYRNGRGQKQENEPALLDVNEVNDVNSGNTKMYTQDHDHQCNSKQLQERGGKLKEKARDKSRSADKTKSVNRESNISATVGRTVCTSQPNRSKATSASTAVGKVDRTRHPTNAKRASVTKMKGRNKADAHTRLARASQPTVIEDKLAPKTTGRIVLPSTPASLAVGKFDSKNHSPTVNDTRAEASIKRKILKAKVKSLSTKTSSSATASAGTTLNNSSSSKRPALHVNVRSQEQSKKLKGYPPGVVVTPPTGDDIVSANAGDAFTQRDTGILARGTRIAVYWPLDRAYYEATVLDYAEKRHRIRYDLDGEVEWLDLSEHAYHILTL